MLPWLLTGGTLALHHPFDVETFFTQRDRLIRGTLVVPGALAARLSRDHIGNLDSVIALWRAPERVEMGSSRSGGLRHLEVTAFGEIGLIASRPAAGGAIKTFPRGIIGAPHHSAAAIPVIETARNAVGRLALRGAMVPATAFPSTAKLFAVSEDGFIDTFYPCRINPDNNTLTITGPQPGMAGVGGYRFAQLELETFVAALSDQVTLVALPDTLTGQRLAGSAPNAGAMQASLAECGCNPLIAHAFRPRGAAAP